jgi:hypothetical protein
MSSLQSPIHSSRNDLAGSSNLGKIFGCLMSHRCSFALPHRNIPEVIYLVTQIRKPLIEVGQPNG